MSRTQTRRSVSMSAILYAAIRERAAAKQTTSARLVHDLLTAGMGVDVPYYAPGTHPINVDSKRVGPRGAPRDRSLDEWRQKRKADPLSADVRPPPGKVCVWCESLFRDGDKRYPNKQRIETERGPMHSGCAEERARVESRTAARSAL